ncbi:MAG: alanine racemase [Spirochaetes bacterium]|nr:alanine racemase [Spirochaetota bacterium]
MKYEYHYFTQALIHLKNLSHNLSVIRSLAGKEKKMIIPVKCNAYSFGMIRVARFLMSQHIDSLAVAFPFEGFILRKNKISSPVLCFNEPLHCDDFVKMIREKITPTVYTERSLCAFNTLAKKKIKVHINIDTGMGRIGVPYKKAFSFIKKAFQLSHIHVEGVYSHLSSADETRKDFTQRQIKQFSDLARQLKNSGYNVPLLHLSNSAGIINYPDLPFNTIRPGIMFYGYFPDNHIKKSIPLKGGMTLRSIISFLKKTQARSPISYGHTYYTKKNEVIATVSLGYGDGLARLLSNHHDVLVQGQKCPVRGRICMDQFMIDTSRVKSVKQGDPVTIFGQDGRGQILLEDVARKLKTIPYEVLCQIGPRVERIYV